MPAIQVAREPTQPFGKEERQHPPELQIHHLTMPIADAIEAYLQEQRNHGRRRKTLEWHQTALGFLRQYLVKERHLTFLSQLTESEVRGWLAFLRTTSSVTGMPRRASTIATYGRSARAFCHWGVRNGYLARLPITRGVLPRGGKKHLQLIEPDVFDRLLLACRPEGAIGTMGDRTAARNRTILWIFMDTGMRASELCGLRLSGVNREQRTLRVEKRGSERWLSLSSNGWYQVLSYLEQYRPKERVSEGEAVVEEDSLFLSETYEPLSINALTLLFDRLRKRAGMSGQHINPSQLRDTFAVHYLRAGGEPDALRALLGLRGKTALTRYEQVSTKKIEHGLQKEHPHGQQLVPHTSEQHRDARNHDGIVGKATADAKEDS